MKTRWVYEWVDDPFCVPHNPHCGAGLGQLCKHCGHDGHCQSCECNGDIRCRKQLVKNTMSELRLAGHEAHGYTIPYVDIPKFI